MREPVARVNTTQPSRRQGLPLPPLTLPQHSCSRIFDMPVKCRCNVFQISFCCAVCLETGACCQIGTRIPKAAVFCWGESRTEMFWSGLEAKVKPDRRYVAPRVSGSALVLLQRIAREIWALVLCELNCLVGLPMTRSQGSGETESEGRK